MTTIEKGMEVEHEFHGQGLVFATSPEHTFAAVAYAGYRRTHHVSTLKVIQNPTTYKE